MQRWASLSAFTKFDLEKTKALCRQNASNRADYNSCAGALKVTVHNPKGLWLKLFSYNSQVAHAT